MTTALNLFKNKNIRNRIIYTLFIFLIFRFGTAITIPNIDVSKFGNIADNSVFALINMLGGGSLQRFSVFALGIGPYITASIITQLLSMDVIPYLSDLNKEGKNGRRKIDKINRYFTLVLAMIQSAFLTKVFDAQYNILIDKSLTSYIYVMITLSAGTLFLLWLGDRITQHGIGNGISMIIFGGIVANYPAHFIQVFQTMVSGNSSSELFNGILKFSGFVVSYLLIIVFVVIMHLAVRKIPIQYTSSKISTVNHSNMTYLPLKINSASVIPVIFASSVMIAPVAIMNLFRVANEGFARHFRNILDLNQPVGLVIYVVLIVLFTFFYANLQIDPEKISENLSKNGTYIPGIRPGKETKDYIYKVLNRITVIGALFLVSVSILPYLIPLVVPSLPSTFGISGTGVIIVVGVAIETVKALQGQLTQKTYKGFITR